MLLKPSNNVRDFYELISIGSALNDLHMEDLGRVDGFPLLLLTPKDIDLNKKDFLVTAGFHGDEVAGPWGLASYLLSNKISANVSFLPLMNPTGLAANKRLNSKGLSPNTGWIHEGELSEEGKIVMEDIHKILPLARDGLLTLHEDNENDQFYLYYFNEDDEIPSKIDEMVLIGMPHFGIVKEGHCKDGPHKDIPIKNGLVANNHDGSFEDFLFHKGIPLTICTETPNRGDPMKRVDTVCNLIECFVS